MEEAMRANFRWLNVLVFACLIVGAADFVWYYVDKSQTGIINAARLGVAVDMILIGLVGSMIAKILKNFDERLAKIGEAGRQS